ncbi:hypothetical protein BJ165DRAFT_1350265 [Panaeolus papilionaceus]|nr:hypothetical protein BJ165DRAFT_1350265 [Panaeolus papilionaceus]
MSQLLQLSIRGHGVLFHQILRFIAYASPLRNDIILSQPSRFHPSAITDNSEPDLYPCLPPAIQIRSNQRQLMKAESRQAVLFTLGYGPVPMWSVHLYYCKINYHNNFRVHNHQRLYYDHHQISILQIGEHQFVEVQLVNYWIRMMLLAWASVTNCARIYNETHATSPIHQYQWQFKFQVTSDQVFDAFILLSLLEDCSIRHETLVLPHTGLAKDCLTAAIQARNNHYRLCRNHKVSAIIIDGITLGHPCCGQPNCKMPLRSNKDCFCSIHAGLINVCSIVDCNNPVVSGKKTCFIAEHQQVEATSLEKGKSRFQLWERLLRANMPAAAIESMEDMTVEAIQIQEGVDEEYVVTETGSIHSAGALEGSNTQAAKKLRIKFGRRCTHNEQLFVAPCGVIVVREMFYHAEALKSVIEMIKRTYRIPGTAPDHIFFDNNCGVAKIVKGCDPFFDNIGLTVDVFHFKLKHSTRDVYCQRFCNPSGYPELLGEGDRGWFFNTSAAEQANTWIGGYQAMCREMSVEKYNFFLDEMLRRHNIITINKLARDQQFPSYWPYPQQ